MRYMIALLIAACCSVLAWAADEPTVPANPQKCEPGLETGTWKAEAWANKGSAEMIDAGAAKALKLSYSAGDKEKAAFRQEVILNGDPEGKVRLHVYAPSEKPPQVAVCLLTGPQADWHEAQPATLKPGWNALEVPLTTPNWKTAGTNWAFKTGVAHAEDVRGIVLIVMNGKTTGWLAIQGLAVDGGAATKAVETLAKKLLSEDGEERAQAEKELTDVGRPAIPILRKLKGHERPEVALRAGWALDKIELNLAAEQRETQAFSEARDRAARLVEDLKTTRARLQRLASDAREELLQAQRTAKDLKAPSDESAKAYDAMLKQLDELSRETLRQVGTQDEQPAEKKTEP